MEYRNTPRYDRLSPSQWLFGRRQRTNAPALPQAYRRLSNEELEKFETLRREEVEARSRKKGSRNLPPLCIGQVVAIQDPISSRWDSRGTIKRILNKKRSYLVDIDGRKFLRNRRFLQPCLIQELPDYAPEPPILFQVFRPPPRRTARRPKKNVRYIETC